MRRLIALVLATALIWGVEAPAAYAGTGTNVALGLASFAVFNQLVRPLLQPRRAYAVPVVETQSIVYTTPAVYTVPAAVVTAAPPPMPTVVQYPHGRYELRGDGTAIQYHWVWIPNPPPPPPAAEPPTYSP